MSATYRIDTAYEPAGADDSVPFIARVYRLSDDQYVEHVWRSTAALAEASAREWVATYEASMQVASTTVYVDDQGRDAEAPQSVKVPE